MIQAETLVHLILYVHALTVRLTFLSPFPPLSTKSYNLGTVIHGPRKENGKNYLLYENGDDCGGGKNYSSRIEMECGDTEVTSISLFSFLVFASCKTRREPAKKRSFKN